MNTKAHFVTPKYWHCDETPPASPSRGGERATRASSYCLPPRPQSADLLTTPNILRGLKRPSDEAHDGNPNKQVCVCVLWDRLW